MTKVLTDESAVVIAALKGKTFSKAVSPFASGIPVNMSDDNSTAEIRIYRPIGTQISDGISGASIADEIAWLSTVVDTIVVRVNSYGGSVLDGMSIIAAMQNSNATIICIIDGVAASIAAVIAICADETYIVDYGLVMTHKTHYLSGSGDSDTLDKFNESLATIFKQRLKTDDVSQFLGDSDNWMNAEQAEKAGLVDHVIPTQARELLNQAKEILSMPSFEIEQVVNIFQNKTVTKPMNEKILNALALAVGATEIDVVNSISELVNKVTERDATIAGLQADVNNKTEEIANLNAKVTGFETKETERKQTEAETVVNAAAQAGKIKNTKEVKAEWVNLYLANPTAVKNSLDAIQVAPKLSTVINQEKEKTERESGEFKPIKISEVMNQLDEKNKKKD